MNLLLTIDMLLILGNKSVTRRNVQYVVEIHCFNAKMISDIKSIPQVDTLYDNVLSFIHPSSYLHPKHSTSNISSVFPLVEEEMLQSNPWNEMHRIQHSKKLQPEDKWGQKTPNWPQTSNGQNPTYNPIKCHNWNNPWTIRIPSG